MERHIFLVGYARQRKKRPGAPCGFQKLQIPYLDTDVYLTEATGMNTAQLYTTFGEQAFRDGETRLLQQLVNAAPGIISTGGGVCLREENRRLMQQSWPDCAHRPSHRRHHAGHPRRKASLCWPKKAVRKSSASITSACPSTKARPMW